MLVTLDELLPRTTRSERGLVFGLEMRACVNGEPLSKGNLKEMTWTFAQILERASYGVALVPGDVIGSGTCGTGCLLELNGSKVTQDLWLRAEIASCWKSTASGSWKTAWSSTLDAELRLRHSDQRYQNWDLRVAPLL